MDENKRNQQNAPGQQQTGSSSGQQGSPQDASNQADENSQRGTSWNNYQTREMGSNQDQSNNSGEQEDDTGGGGTLY